MPSLDKIDISLGGLEAYDLINLSQRTRASNFDYNRELGEGNKQQVMKITTT